MVSNVSPDLIAANLLINQTATEIATGQFTEAQIAKRISDLLAENGTFIIDVFERARVFSYSQPLQQVDAECVTDFARTFQHTDWIDGESVVQAEQTTFEDGFNWRFHRIEDDIDALGADVANAFACVAELRASLFTALNDLRTEINRVNQDVFECCRSRDTGGPIFVPPILTTPGGVGNWVGNTVINDKQFLVYENFGQYALVPKVDLPENIIPPRGGGVFDPGNLRDRLARGAELTRWLETNPDGQRFVEEHGQGFRVDDLVENFRDTIINADTGLTLGEAVSSIAPGSEFATPDALVDRVVELETAAVRGSGGVNRLLGSLGVASRSEVDTVSVSNLNTVNEDMSTALTNAGVGTVGELTNLQPDELVTRLGNAGIEVSRGQANAILTDARSLRLLGRGQ